MADILHDIGARRAVQRLAPGEQRQRSDQIAAHRLIQLFPARAAGSTGVRWAYATADGVLGLHKSWPAAA